MTSRVSLKVTSIFLSVVMMFYAVSPIIVYSVDDGQEQNNVEDTPKLSVYHDGKIFIYNYQQLMLIGSGNAVKSDDAKAESIGTGTNVLSGENPVLYSLDADYELAHDIALPKRTLWQLPAGFTGTISGGQPDEMPLYDSETDTVYIYNPYQLEVMAMDNAEYQPVLNGDTQNNTFGTGQPVLSDGKTVTYGKNHNYVLSQYFNSSLENPSSSVRTALPHDDCDGRDFQGQVIKTLNGTDYILIGNEDQLRAIGSNAPVYTAIYRADRMTMIYGGDADLLQSQNGTADYNFHEFTDITGVLEYGVYQSDGTGHHKGDIHQIHNSYDTGKKYSSTENYIIFRDIDLGNRAWTPLMFYGTMTGAKALSGEKIWNDTDITAKTRPAISNVSITQDSAIDISDYMGVGFFATLTPTIENLLRTVKISNIELNNVSVENNTTELEVDSTVISTVTKTLGKILGTVLNGLLWTLSIGQLQLDLDDGLEDMLDAKTKDKSNLATGAFAGRVVGDVNIEDCAVTGTVNVSNNNDRTGGFVGYTDGETQYGGLTRLLGGVVALLSDVLNVVPWLGAGDLVTILLANALPVQYLVPTGYINPVIRNCEVNGLQNTVGKNNTNLAGGFVGQQIGTIIENCEIKNSNYTVKAKSYGGGFSGIARDEQIRSTLTDVGIDFPALLEDMQAKSLLKDCSINNSTVRVSGIEELGGFVGALYSSYAVNCSITGQEENSVKVTGSGDYVGGFCGNASLGWLFGGEDDDKTSLLQIVGGLVTSLLSNNEKKEALLSLMGAEPSAIMGVDINCGEIEVSGKKYVGGILGNGDGVYLTESSPEYLENLAFWKYNKIPYPQQSEVKSNYLHNLKSVSASEYYAGGVAGSVGTASAVGLLNSTLGVADFIGFTVRNVTVDGIEEGYTVSAGNSYAGGAFGTAIGGTVYNVTLNSLKSVTAENKSAGFAGCSGPGDLIGNDGVSVHLLGLDNLLSVKNLLSVGQGVEVDVTDCTVNGIADGLEVSATGQGNDTYTASGFIARSHSTKVTNSHVYNLKSVIASDSNGYAGGFLGISETGGLAEITEVDNETHTLKGIEIGNLVNLVSYLIPKYENCTVTYIDNGYVQADLAGGFVADFRSGTVDNSSRTDDYYAVYNIDDVRGQTYGGGFGGRLVSGALANAGGGISVLGNTNVNIDISDLLKVINAYVPYVKYAGVYSENGFTVEADAVRSDDLQSGSAGGFAGYTSGAQISYSDVYRLKHTAVFPPSDLEAVEAPTYYDGTSAYAVTGGRYAGGYVGDMDIGSAASVGSGLKVLGNAISLTNVLDALSVVVTTIEHSDVYGYPGGFAVIADGVDGNNIVGMAGGFAGSIYGGHIQDSHSRNFSYIIGEETAGGYVGNMEPGNVANILDNGSILEKLVNVSGALASLVEDFVPTIRNSTTSCIPCGGAVRANAPSTETELKGCAGGYCGHNEGGHIWGFDTHTWKEENDGKIINGKLDKRLGSYTGRQSECKADRIRSVYGYEYAGGFTGLMESADTASTGSIGLLDGVLPKNGIQITNILNALEFVYPTQRNTAVYGPLRNLDVYTWNSWIDYVGKYGGYGYELAFSGKISLKDEDDNDKTPEQLQEELDEKLKNYVYGYNVVAGRSEYVNFIRSGGDAGGYVGMMSTGVIENGQAYDAKLVKAMRNAGGFAGKMKTGGLASFGSVSIVDITIDLGSLIAGGALQVLVPKAENSSVEGYRSGLTVTATGTDFLHGCGNAGGYVGSGYGAQIWGDRSSLDNVQPKGCNVKNLRCVYGNYSAGGFAGMLTSASVADANTNISDGVLQGILDSVIKSNGNLASLLQATLSTVYRAEVSADDENWGFGVKGYNNTPKFAGGFAGQLEASIIGDKDGNTDIKIKNLREVSGGLYAGGFFGLADVGGVAKVSGSGENTTNILGLVQAGQVDVLDVFRTYIYHSDVEGIDAGITVTANSSDSEGILNETRYSGCAGGFGGGIMNGTVKNSSVKKVSTVKGLNYTGGFIGHMGKNGVADVDSADIASLLGVTAGVLDVFGAHAENCSVEGINEGMVVQSQNGQQEISGGFAGYADVSRIKNSHVTKLKQVYSDETAGGFVGKTEMHYLVEAEVNSTLVNIILKIVNFLVKALYLPNLENAGLLDLEIPGLAELKLFSDGDAVYINLLGLKIGVSLVKAVEEGQTDTAIVTIGDSSVRLPCTNQGVDTQGKDHEIVVNLLKGNATKIENSSVKGINIGYDVYGGGAYNDADGTNANGYAGGFVGYNNEGRMHNNEMIYCDVVRGFAGKVGHFSGYSSLQTVYNHSSDELEYNNQYHVYRNIDSSYQYALTQNGDLIGSSTTETGTYFNRFDLINLQSPVNRYSDWKNAYISKTTATADAERIKVYESSAKAVLMLDIATNPNPPIAVAEPADVPDPCEETIDLVINVVWDDLHNMYNTRPDEVQIIIYQYMIDENGDYITDGEGNPIVNAYTVDEDGNWFTMSREMHLQNGTEVWRTEVHDVPSHTTGTNGEMIYYSYRVDEQPIEAYTTKIFYNDSLSQQELQDKNVGYAATVFNRYRPPMPETGGQSDWVYVVLGIVIIISGMVLFRKPEPERKGEKMLF